MRKSLLVLTIAALVALIPVSAFADGLCGSYSSGTNLSSNWTTPADLGVNINISDCTSTSFHVTVSLTTAASDAGYALVGISEMAVGSGAPAGKDGGVGGFDGFGKFYWGNGEGTPLTDFIVNASDGTFYAGATSFEGLDGFAAHVKFAGDSCTGYVSTATTGSSDTLSNCTTTSTPEPASLALLGAGLLGLSGLVRRKK